MFGWTGRILHIDLDEKKAHSESPDPTLYTLFLGGRGLAGHYLNPSVTLPWDSPDMPLLLFPGPLTGTRSPSSGRMTIMSRSPLTGTVGDSSVGGRLGTHIKKAGWDGIVIRGRSRSLCGIHIRDSEVVFRDPFSLKGKTTSQIFDALADNGSGNEELNRKSSGIKNSTAVIGPAAENGVRFSNIVVDRRFFAGGICVKRERNGVGETLQQARVVLREGGALRRHGVCDSGPEAGDHIKLPFADQRMPLLFQG